jgi:outer membrane murein-binding lipoprotein Lpp
MSKNEVQRRSQRWTRRSEKPIRYGLLARLADWWCATHDARRGLPELPEDDRSTPDPEVPTGTPHMSFLGHQGIERMAKEWIVYQSEVADPMAHQSDLEAKREALRDELKIATERFGTLDRGAADSSRVAGEERTDAGIVAQRRVNAYAAKRDEAKAKVDRLTADLNGMSAEIAQIAKRVAIRREIHERRADIIEAHIRRRRAAYETRLVRKHPQGLFLNRLLRPEWPDVPDWVVAAPARVPQARTRDAEHSLADQNGGYSQ